MAAVVSSCIRFVSTLAAKISGIVAERSESLKAQMISDRARAQTESAADLLREAGPVTSAQIQEACSQVALLAYLDSLIESGQTLARNTSKKNPAKMVTLMNTICNLANAGRQLDKQKTLLLKNG